MSKQPDPGDEDAGGAMAIRSRSRWLTRLLVVFVVLTVASTAMLGLRTYRTLTLLSSAFQVGVPEVSSVRPWMTLRYVAGAYRVPEAALREQLGLASETEPDTTLKALAERAGVSPPVYTQRVQRAIAAVARVAAEPGADTVKGEPDGTGEGFISAVLVYGYPALALTLLLGALGLPLPSGLSMIVAGSIAAQGRISWPVAAVVATLSSVAGDVAGFYIGRVVGGSFLERWGRWLGLTSARRARVERLFERWGALSVLLSRSLVSVLSSTVNVVAGAGRYPFGAFLAFGIVGRLLWTSAYLGLGYVASGGLEPAADFLRSLTGFLISLALLAASALALRRSGVRPKVSV